MRQERERRQWSQADLSQRLIDKGMDTMYPSTVAKVEAGERTVRIEEAFALADLFDVSVDWLGGREDGLEDDAIYTLRSVLDSAQQSGMQIAGIRTTLTERFAELDGLDIKGLKDLQRQAAAVVAALQKADDGLGRIALFRMGGEVPTGDFGAAFNNMVIKGSQR